MCNEWEGGGERKKGEEKGAGLNIKRIIYTYIHGQDTDGLLPQSWQPKSAPGKLTWPWLERVKVKIDHLHVMFALEF